ncbi:MAG TPA: bifunctional phosphopantothenoylcysteine decarboxylase/phosphopantothenate--cysteine ligase CoaBC [Armatimonadetes bacterium]|nr:bifunctional phosphopantothenoylcysteine decarboxylase/phosphopantothenate--cysteine ligase CoaBC [Armatimonadota bacterium]
MSHTPQPNQPVSDPAPFVDAGTFQGKTIVVGVTGSIAAYKAADLVSRLTQAGADVRVILTAHAQEFIAPLTFRTLSGREALTDLFAAPEAYRIRHLSLAEQADALIVAPATANLIGKAAAGIADDLLTTTLLAVTCPLLFAPAMNEAMYRNALVQRNLEVLREHGCLIIEPEEGWLACRQVGRGRLAATETLVQALALALWQPKDYAGRRVLVTAGPTREFLDPVRFLSNPSSGKMGYALAAAAAQRGASVTLVSGPTNLPPPYGVERVEVTSAAEMHAAVMARAAEQEVILGAAAVADYAPAERASQKVKKSEAEWTLTLRPTPDILAELGQRKGNTVLVGFAAETENLAAHAQEKLRAKNLDAIAANDLTRAETGFQSDTNAVTLFFRDGRREDLPLMSKNALAHALLERIRPLLGD